MRSLPSTTAAFVIALAVPASAVADDDDPFTSSYDDPVYVSTPVRADPWQTVERLGILAGRVDIGGVTTTHAGLLFGAGVRHDRLTLHAELQIGYDQTEDEPVTSGFVGEASLHVRRDAMHWDVSDSDFGGMIATWIDLGAGAEVLWFGGDRVIRPEASLGIGLGVEAWKHETGKHGGIALEFRIIAAPSIEWSDLAERCIDACTMRLAKPDFTGLFVFAVPFRL